MTLISGDVIPHNNLSYGTISEKMPREISFQLPNGIVQSIDVNVAVVSEWSESYVRLEGYGYYHTSKCGVVAMFDTTKNEGVLGIIELKLSE